MSDCAIMRDYLGSNCSRCFDSFGGRWGENVDRLFGMGQYISMLGEKISIDKGDAKSAEKWGSVANSFDIAGGALGVVRTIVPLEQLATGKLVCELDSQGRVVRRDFIAIIMSIMSLAARFLSTAAWVIKHVAHHLKDDVKKINRAVMSLWIIVTALDIVQNARAYWNDDNSIDGEGRTRRDRDLQRVVEVSCDGLDIAGLPVEFGYGQSVPYLFILPLIAKAAYLIKDVVYYR